jgi:hypothetical protein
MPTPPPSNPDSEAMKYLADLLKDFEIEFPDGDSCKLRQIDLGFTSKPTHNPYVSIQPLGSRAPVVRLGVGSGIVAREFEIDLLVTIEYEDLNAERGAERTSQLRWEVFRKLAENVRKFPGVEIADIDEAIVQSFSNDDGSFQDWGYIAQIIIPVTIKLRGTT